MEKPITPESGVSKINPGEVMGAPQYQYPAALNLKDEMFCRYFASPTEFYGNGVQSYAAAHDLQVNSFNYDSIKAMASNLLIRPVILERINQLLDKDGLNDEFVDKQLLFLVTQGVDFRSKLGAIREYNKLKARVADRLVIEAPVTTINVVPAKVLDDGKEVKVHDSDPSAE